MNELARALGRRRSIVEERGSLFTNDSRPICMADAKWDNSSGSLAAAAIAAVSPSGRVRRQSEVVPRPAETVSAKSGVRSVSLDCRPERIKARASLDILAAEEGQPEACTSEPPQAAQSTEEAAAASEASNPRTPPLPMTSPSPRGRDRPGRRSRCRHIVCRRSGSESCLQGSTPRSATPTGARSSSSFFHESSQADGQLAPKRDEAEEPVRPDTETAETNRQTVPSSALDVAGVAEIPAEAERTEASNTNAEAVAEKKAKVELPMASAAEVGTCVSEVEVTQDVSSADACDKEVLVVSTEVLHEPMETAAGTSSVEATSEPKMHANAALELDKECNGLFELSADTASEAAGLDTDASPRCKSVETMLIEEGGLAPFANEQLEAAASNSMTPLGEAPNEGAKAMLWPETDEGSTLCETSGEHEESPSDTTDEGRTEEKAEEGSSEKDATGELNMSPSETLEEEGTEEKLEEETHHTTPEKSALVREADREFWGTPPTATAKQLNNSVELFEGEGITRAGLAAPWEEMRVLPRRQRWLCCIVDDESTAVSDGDVETFEDEVEAWQVAWIRQGLEDIERATCARVRREVFAAWLDVVHPGATLRAASTRRKATAERAGLHVAHPTPEVEEPTLREATTQTSVEATTQTCVEERGHTQQSQANKVREHAWLDAGTLKRANAQQGTVTGDYWRSRGAFDDAASTAASSLADQSAINWTPGTAGGSLGSIAPGSSLRSVTPGGSVRGIPPGSGRPPLVPSTTSSAASSFGRSGSVCVLEERDTRIEVPVHVVPRIVEAAPPTSDACLIVPKIVEVPVTVEVCEPKQPRQTMEVRKICQPTYTRSVTVSSCSPVASIAAPPAHARGPPPQGRCLRVLSGMSTYHQPMQAMA